MLSRLQLAVDTGSTFEPDEPRLAYQQQQPRAKLLLLGTAPALTRALGDVIAIPPRANIMARTSGIGHCLAFRRGQYLLLLESPHAAQRIRDQLRSSDSREGYCLDAGARFVEFAISGPQASAILSAGCSLDLRPLAFPLDTCAGTRIEQIPVVILRTTLESFELLVERPLARCLWLWMRRAAESV